MIQIERYSDLVSRLSYDCEGLYKKGEKEGLSKSFSIIIERAIYEQENLDAVKHSHDYIYEYLTTLEKELKWVSNQLELYKADVIKELVNKIENILFDISVFKYIIESSFNIESKKV